MNDESDQSLTPVGDDALEARIVAWVLGEASSFEAAELEKLCAEDPALGVFAERMRVLHGLLAEDVKAGPDAEWKLPEAKRAKVTDLLGVDEEVLQKVIKADRYFARRSFLAAAACLMISLVAYTVFGPGFFEKRTIAGAPEKSVDFMPAVMPELAQMDASRARGGAGSGGGFGGAAKDQVELKRSAGGADLEAAASKAESAIAGAPIIGGRFSKRSNPPIESPAEPELLAEDSITRATPVPAQKPASSASGALAENMPADSPAMRTAVPAPAKASEEVRYKIDSANPALAKDEAAVDSFAPAAPIGEGDTKLALGSEEKIGGLADSAKKDLQSPALASGGAGGEVGESHSLGLKVAPSADRYAWSVGDEMTKAPTDFQNLKEMGELADNLKSTRKPSGTVGGMFYDSGTPPPITHGMMDLDSLSSLDRPRLGKDPGGSSFLDAGGAFNTNTSDPQLWSKSLEENRLAGGIDGSGMKAPEEVRRKLYIAEGNYNLGKFDDAQRAYEDVIRTDPYNKAARRGMEVVSQAKEDYYRAAYDHSRAELLAQVDKSWELKAEPEVEDALKAGQQAQPEAASGPATPSSLARQEILRRQNTMMQADSLRAEGQKAFEEGDYTTAYATQSEAMKLLPADEAGKEQKAALSRQLAESAAAEAESQRSKGDEERSREWAGKALQWDASNKSAKAILNVGPSSETSATAEPFSTFSLHVSDASFKLAKAAMDRGEQPDPAGIRPEEFYNAFDYGDPAPGRGEPVACALEQAGHPAIPQRNLLRIAVRTGSAGRGQSTPLNLTLLLDSSGSMEREDRHVGMTLAIQQLSQLLKEGDTISVIGFSRTPRLLADRLPGARAAELNALIAQTPSEGGTNLEEGLRIAGELARRQFDPAAQNRVVLFTDGAANLGDAQPETLQARVEALRQQGVAFDAAGFGADGLNDRLLERLTRNGNGRYYVVDSAEDANANFSKQLAGAFRPAAENVKVQVRFNPARVGKYKLIGFEEHRLNKEDFHNDAVDAAEMAAEEAGNALYQVEALPGGEGEIGEVSVRFRDVASGQMVERTWTIPYEAQAPAFDQAPASIQLAGLAAFTAEKLRHAPLSDAVDFQQLGQTFGKVKARYQNSQTVSDLGTMIGKLK